jgi:uncharacterized membrane protein (UPF0127 family)
MITRIMTGGRRRLALGIATLLVLGAAITGVFMFSAERTSEVPLEIGDARYTVRVVSSGDEREKGLSGTASLARDKGMLFVFDEDKQWGIWMKDMNYAIDILWLDQSKTVVDMAENATPASYPKTIFKPKVPARYVLELAAGSVSDASIAVGSKATFNVNASGGSEI